MFRQWSLGFVCAVVVGLAPAASAGDGWLVQFGDTITHPGVYYLDGDQSGAGDGICIESDWVTLLLGNHTLSGNGTGEGIKARDRRGITIIGGRITNFEDGIDFKRCSRALIKALRVDNNTDAGIDLEACHHMTIARVECCENGNDGFEVDGCEWILFLSLRVHDNEDDGIQLGADEELGPCRYNVIRDGSFYDNEEAGIELTDSSRNTIIHNWCSGNDEGVLLCVSTDAGTPTVIPEEPETRMNLVKFNVCPRNDVGIEVRWGARDNHIGLNTALWNDEYDLFEDNSECPNSWFANLYHTTGGLGEHCIN